MQEAVLLPELPDENHINWYIALLDSTNKEALALWLLLSFWLFQKIKEKQTAHQNPFTLQKAKAADILKTLQTKHGFDISLELIYRITQTDYLDDVSEIYPNPLFLKSSEAIALSNRSLENISARTGTDRTAKLIELLAEKGITTSNPYPIIQQMTSTGSLRGDDKKTDSYLTFTLKVSYHIPDAITCPKWN